MAFHRTWNGTEAVPYRIRDFAGHLLWQWPRLGCYNPIETTYVLALSTKGPAVPFQAQLISSIDSALWPGPLLALVYGFIGIFLLIAGYKLFDWITPQIHVQKELYEKNTAVAIVIAALLLGVAYIVAQVVAG